MFFIKILIITTALGSYTYLVTSPFRDEIDSLEKDVVKLESLSDKKTADVKDCRDIRDKGTKRFIDFIDERIEETKDPVKTELNVSNVSWSNMVLGIKGDYND